MKPIFFSTPADLREWFEEHHDSAEELWAGFFKKGTARISLSIREAVDQALCFGWIDGILKKTGKEEFIIRFTPRRKGSTWSEVNTKRAKELIKMGLMQPAGLSAFEQRDPEKTNQYSYEQRTQGLPPEYLSIFKKDRIAWNFFRVQPPGYQKTLSFWVTDAKQKETRLKRLKRLIEVSRTEKRVDLLSPFGKDKK